MMFYLVLNSDIQVMGGLVSGAWVVTRRYIEASYKAGAWANPKAYVCDDLVLRHRERREQMGPMFRGVRVVFALNNSVQSRVYSRIVRAGGGEVIPYTTVQDLVANHSKIESIDFVVVDKTQDLSELTRIVQDRRQSGSWSGLCRIEYKYFFSCITHCNRVNVRDFLVLESERRLHAQKRGSDVVGGEVKRFRRDPVVVDLNSSDDEDLEILEQRLAARSAQSSRRVYYERNVTGEVITIADNSDLEEESKEDSNISLGLKQAISALQPRVLTKPRVDTADTSEDEIEIVMTKPGESRKTSSVDRKTLLFQSRLKEIKDVDEETGSASSRSQDEVSSQRSLSPISRLEVAAEPVPTDPPSQPFPNIEEADNSKLVRKVLDCIVERQTMTGECLSVRGISLKTIKYDSHDESSVARRRELVDSSVREEFYRKHQERPSLSDSDDSQMVSQLSRVSNIMTSIRFLHHFTSLSCHATPAILNNLMVEVIMKQTNPVISSQALHYLQLTMFRQVVCVSQNIMDRQCWLSSILSSCRHGSNINFDSFDITNKQDLALCTKFFLQMIRDLRSQKEGALKLLKLLVDICEKDIQLLWRPSSKSSHNYPLLFYLLGDSPATVMANIKTHLIPLYITSLDWSNDNAMLRRCLTITAIMMAGLDSSNKQSYINCGTKLELANALAQALYTWQKNQTKETTSNLLWSELYLLEPDWFVMLTSRSLLSLTSSGTMSRLSSLSQLSSALSQLQPESPASVNICFQTLLYKTISTCHIHTCLRTFWSSVLDTSDTHVYSHMSRLNRVQEKKKDDIKVVRFRSGVTCKVPQILEDITCLSQYCYGDNADHHRPVMSSLLFVMNAPLSF